MSEVISTYKQTVKVTVSIEIMENHLNFAREIAGKMGKASACKYLYHVYPKISLLNAETIIEDYL